MTTNSIQSFKMGFGAPNINLGYQNQIYHWYGLPTNFTNLMLPSAYDVLVWGIDPKQSYNTITLDSKIEFNDGAINTAANLTIDIGSGSNNSTGSSSNVNLSSADLVVVSGDGNLSFSAPSDGDRGSFTVNIDLSNLSWLKYDWDLDGSHDDSPPGVTGTFGIYGGHSKILFRRESN